MKDLRDLKDLTVQHLCGRGAVGVAGGVAGQQGRVSSRPLLYSRYRSQKVFEP